MLCIGVVGIGVKYAMRHALNHVAVGYVAQHAKVLVPRKVETGETFSRHACLAIHVGGRCRGADRLEAVVKQKVVLWLPKFAHRHICPFVILQGAGRKNVAGGSLIAHRHARIVGAL